MTAPEAYEWTGEPSDLGGPLSRLVSSGAYVVADTAFDIPTREDYRTALAAARLPPEGAALEDEPDLVAAVQAHWHAAAYNACVFAENLSGTRAESGWESYVLAPAGQPDEIALAIATICVERLPVPEVQVVSVLMPRLDDPRELVRFLRRLGSLPDWRLDELDRVSSELGDIVLLGLRAKVELDH